MLKNKTLLITGGTGSFGNAVLNRFLDTDHFSEIRIFSRDEKKQDEMRKRIDSDKVKYFIGDVREPESLEFAFKGVDYIFHAAALKQVPSCEFHPYEALKTNSIGAQNVLKTAFRNQVSKVICLSTDKAVYPINAMGMTKAMMEKIAISKSRMNSVETDVICTRYGNVMASRGSVIPLFISQIKQRKPITVTDPNMTRFMMSLDDAVDLVLYAFENGKPGDLFVQKAPATNIGQLAKVLRKMFNSKSEIKIIGTRHGEKLYETLVTREEKMRSEDLGGYFRIFPDDRDLNYSKYFSEGDQKISEIEDYHSHNTHQLSEKELEKLLLKLEYVNKELKINV